MPVKLIAVGTRISHPHCLAMLRRAHEDGIHVVLATSRGPQAAQAAAAELGLRSPLITTNGARVWAAPHGELWAEHPLAAHIVERLHAEAERHGWLLEATPYGVVCRQPEGIAALHTLCQEELDDDCRTELFYDQHGALHGLLIVAPQANKRTALTLVLKRLKLKGKHVLALGDNHNDIAMFSLAEASVALADAPPAVRVSATAVGPRSSEGGIGWALERFVYGGG